MKLKFKENIIIRKARTKNQNCLYCGKPLKIGVPIISLSNKGDNISMKKYLYIHIGCFEEFCEKVSDFIDENETEIMVNMI